MLSETYGVAASREHMALEYVRFATPICVQYEKNLPANCSEQRVLLEQRQRLRRHEDPWSSTGVHCSA